MKKQTNKLPTLPEAMASVHPNAVNAMVRRINKAIADREAFEVQKLPHGSHIELRRAKAYLVNNRTLAAFLSVCGADPDKMVNRTRKDGYRSNLKGIKKLRNLVDYVTGKTRSFERVSLALFASSIIAAKRGIKWISNTEQELILSSLDVTSLPQDVRDAIKHYQNAYLRIEGDSRNQACQFRTTFDNLGCYFFSREDVEDANRLGIMINQDSPVIQYLASQWELDKVA